jgi:hypothetical protein
LLAGHTLTSMRCSAQDTAVVKPGCEAWEWPFCPLLASRVSLRHYGEYLSYTFVRFNKSVVLQILANTTGSHA